MVVLVIGLFIGIVVAASRGSETSTDVFSTQKVAIIPIEGEIFEARDTIEALHRYADNVTVKAIVMRINSPGGAIAPSQEIYEAVRNTRKRSGKPIWQTWPVNGQPHWRNSKRRLRR